MFLLFLPGVVLLGAHSAILAGGAGTEVEAPASLALCGVALTGASGGVLAYLGLFYGPRLGYHLLTGVVLLASGAAVDAVLYATAHGAQERLTERG